MASYNVTLGKIERGKKLTSEEYALVSRALTKDKRRHAVWKKYPCVWECSNCKFWVDRYCSPDFSYPDDYIKNYRYCPHCGAEMEVIK